MRKKRPHSATAGCQLVRLLACTMYVLTYLRTYVRTYNRYVFFHVENARQINVVYSRLCATMWIFKAINEMNVYNVPAFYVMTNVGYLHAHYIVGYTAENHIFYVLCMAGTKSYTYARANILYPIVCTHCASVYLLLCVSLPMPHAHPHSTRALFSQRYAALSHSLCRPLILRLLETIIFDCGEKKRRNWPEYHGPTARSLITIDDEVKKKKNHQRTRSYHSVAHVVRTFSKHS